MTEPDPAPHREPDSDTCADCGGSLSSDEPEDWCTCREDDDDDEPEHEDAAAVEARRLRIEAMFEGKPIAAPKLVPGGYPVAILERVERGDEAAIDELAVFLHKGATELMRRGRGGLLCTAYVFCRDDVMGGATPDPLYVTHIATAEGHDYDQYETKNLLTSLVHGIAMIGRARAVAFLMEAWIVTRKADGPPLPKGVSFEDIPGRKEIVMVSLETKSLGRQWNGEIVRYGGRGFMIRPFVKMSADIKFQGRFFGVMQPGYDPVRAAHPDAAVDVARTYPPSVDPQKSGGAEDGGEVAAIPVVEGPRDQVDGEPVP